MSPPQLNTPAPPPPATHTTLTRVTPAGGAQVKGPAPVKLTSPPVHQQHIKLRKQP
jgi:hypothetical protein